MQATPRNDFFDLCPQDMTAVRTGELFNACGGISVIFYRYRRLGRLATTEVPTVIAEVGTLRVWSELSQYRAKKRGGLPRDSAIGVGVSGVRKYSQIIWRRAAVIPGCDRLEATRGACLSWTAA